MFTGTNPESGTAVPAGTALSARHRDMGRNRPPPGALDQLVELGLRIDRAADEAVLAIPDDFAGEVELGLAVDDAEARALGWPCVGAHRAVIALAAARAMAEGHRVAVVARSSTPATAAAADAHGR
jgi:hypothetical protein